MFGWGESGVMGVDGTDGDFEDSAGLATKVKTALLKFRHMGGKQASVVNHL